MKPWQILHIDLNNGIADLVLDTAYSGVRLIVWSQNLPLGHVDLDAQQLPMSRIDLTNRIVSTIAPSVGNYLIQPGFSGQLPYIPQADREGPALTDVLALTTPFAQLRSISQEQNQTSVSVVVCTRDRPELLQPCLRSLLALDPAPMEIIVVDNASSSEATHQVVSQFPTVRYVQEPRPGLSFARNTGIRESRGVLIAFTDDDVTVHFNWIAQVQQAFVDDQTVAMTGLVLPQNIETEAQFLFEKELAWFHQGYRSKRFDRAFFAATQHLGAPVWAIGAGANMAFRRSIFDAIGVFDHRLGAGQSGCSEDSELWYRVLAEGWICRYEPSAIVYHTHRGDLKSLRHQLYQYMRGHVVALLIQFDRYRHWGNLRRLCLGLPKYYLQTFLFHAVWGRHHLNRLLLVQMRGAIAGIFYYFIH